MSNLLSGDGRYQDLLGLNSTSLSVIMDELEVNNNLTLDYITPNKNIVSDANKKLISEDKDTFVNTDGNISISQSNRQFTFDLSLGLNGDKNVITDATGGFTTIDQDTILGTTNQVIVNQLGRQFTLSTPQDISTTSDVLFDRINLPTDTNQFNTSNKGLYFGSNEDVGIFGLNDVWLGFKMNNQVEYYMGSQFRPRYNNDKDLGFPSIRWRDLFCYEGDFITQVKIGSNTINTTIASHLVSINQDLNTTDNVNFNVITCNEINAGTVSHTSISCETIEIGGYTVDASIAEHLVEINQDLGTTDDVVFNSVNAGNVVNAFRGDFRDEVYIQDFFFTKNTSTSNLDISREFGIAGNIVFDKQTLIPASTANGNTLGSASVRWSNIYGANGDYNDLKIGSDYEFSQVSNNLVIQRTGIASGNIDTNNLTIDGRDIASDGGQLDTLWTNFGALTQTQVGYIQGLDQALDTTANVSFSTVNTGQGDNELYAMDQNVRTTDAVSFSTVNTGQGANELYAMNQNVRTTDDVKFDNLEVWEVGGTSITNITCEFDPNKVGGGNSTLSTQVTTNDTITVSPALNQRQGAIGINDIDVGGTDEVVCEFFIENWTTGNTIWVGFGTNNFDPSLQQNIIQTTSVGYYMINLAQGGDRIQTKLKNGPNVNGTTLSSNITTGPGFRGKYRMTINTNRQLIIDHASTIGGTYSNVYTSANNEVDIATNGSDYRVLVYDTNTQSSDMNVRIAGTISRTTTSTGQGTIKTDYLQPYTASTTDDNYVLCSAGNNVKRFIRTRSGASPYTRCGFMISGGDGSNYYNSVNSATNGVLLWHYNNTLDFSTASEVMRLGINGNLTIQGTYSPFTGSHISKNILEVEDGLLLSSTDETEYHTIINSNIYTKLSNSYKDKGVIGVAFNNQDELQIVSNGEGGCQVCSEVIDDVVQSPIEIGDYICSYFDGYATKQDDDILHNYTMAKSIQNYDFTTNYMEFVKDDKTYRKALIAIILK